MNRNIFEQVLSRITGTKNDMIIFSHLFNQKTIDFNIIAIKLFQDASIVSYGKF